MTLFESDPKQIVPLKLLQMAEITAKLSPEFGPLTLWPIP